MTIQTLARAIKNKKPAIIKEGGIPRYAVLDWEMYKEWTEEIEDLQNRVRFQIAVRKSKGKKHYSLGEIKKRYNLK